MVWVVYKEYEYIKGMGANIQLFQKGVAFFVGLNFAPAPPLGAGKRVRDSSAAIHCGVDSPTAPPFLPRALRGVPAPFWGGQGHGHANKNKKKVKNFAKIE